jgi:hypothetical protein
MFILDNSPKQQAAVMRQIKAEGNSCVLSEQRPKWESVCTDHRFICGHTHFAHMRKVCTHEIVVLILMHRHSDSSVLGSPTLHTRPFS